MGVEPNSAGVPWSLLMQPRKSNRSLCHMPLRVSPLMSSQLGTSSDFFQPSSNTQLHRQVAKLFYDFYNILRDTQITFIPVIWSPYLDLSKT